ncbi:MAG: hypothetical protein HOQ22_01945 [Nocardioidaceae bacterium]|nr:hypothetical protein [Nocardioidaceae bacterium]NUS49787.1 hypothetical protein [Nocardioidaceae bacterium]
MSDGTPPLTRRVRSRLGRARRALSLDTDVALHDVHARLDRQHERIAALERDLARIGPQVAALESRLEDVRAHGGPVSADAADLEEARTLVAEMRREHERMRARVSAASRFEERLGQVEEVVAGLTHIS